MPAPVAGGARLVEIVAFTGRIEPEPALAVVACRERVEHLSDDIDVAPVCADEPDPDEVVDDLRNVPDHREAFDVAGLTQLPPHPGLGLHPAGWSPNPRQITF